MGKTSAPNDNRERRSCAMQMLCGCPQEVGLAAASVIRRPAGARHAGQPSRWARSWENRKRCAGSEPMESSIRRALETKSAAGPKLDPARDPERHTLAGARREGRERAPELV